MVTRRERGVRADRARRGQAHGRECSGRQGRECDAVERAVHGVSSPCLFVVYRLSLGYRRCEAGAHCDPQVRKLRDVWWATALLGSPPLVCVGWRVNGGPSESNAWPEAAGSAPFVARRTWSGRGRAEGSSGCPLV